MLFQWRKANKNCKWNQQKTIKRKPHCNCVGWVTQEQIIFIRTGFHLMCFFHRCFVPSGCATFVCMQAKRPGRQTDKHELVQKFNITMNMSRDYCNMFQVANAAYDLNSQRPSHTHTHCGSFKIFNYKVILFFFRLARSEASKVAKFLFPFSSLINWIKYTVSTNRIELQCYKSAGKSITCTERMRANKTIPFLVFWLNEPIGQHLLSCVAPISILGWSSQNSKMQFRVVEYGIYYGFTESHSRYLKIYAQKINSSSNGMTAAMKYVNGLGVITVDRSISCLWYCN